MPMPVACADKVDGSWSHQYSHELQSAFQVLLFIFEAFIAY